jgi:hypothetical protein
MSKRLDEALKKHHIEVTIKPLFGEGAERTYHLVPLKHREAKEVFYDVLFSLIGVLGEIGGQDTKDMNVGKMVTALKKEISTAELLSLANRLLHGAVVNNEPVGDVDENEYFDANPLELLQITLHAIMENWPNYFGKLRQALNGFNLPEKMKDLAP